MQHSGTQQRAHALTVSLKLAQNTLEHLADHFSSTPYPSCSALSPLPQWAQPHGDLVCLPHLTIPGPPTGGTRQGVTNTVGHLGVSIFGFQLFLV